MIVVLLCVGRGSVQVGVGAPVSLTFARRFNLGGQPAKGFFQATRQSASLPAHVHHPQQPFRPFSARQQSYAANLIDAPSVSLYGCRARWAVDDDSVDERCFLLQAESPDDAVALLRMHLEKEFPRVDLREIRVEMDDSRLETIVSHFSVFTTSRVSQLDEYDFIDSFRLGPVIEPS
ncbi:hypothetical protein [Microbacterium testaceum]|uniref:Uncharacterized protein n=1 Tax=Microbacterium testaceum TaxID=2033 RepID=A0A2T7WNN3_MICTE|nr:hypothetical protein [Microbacterium testaceum]PVE76201.1 hypothetical protein DC432_06145 [Microbacterium testaceum]